MEDGMTKLDSSSQELLRDMCGLADEMLSRADLTILEKSSEEYLAVRGCLLFFVRMIRIFRAFALIVENGYGPEAELLARPLWEILIDWRFIEKDPKNRWKRYYSYGIARQLEQYREQGCTACEQQFISKYGDAVKHFLDTYHCKGPKLPRHWYVDMRQRSDKVGLTNYYHIYCYQSDFIHNNAIIASRYIDASEPGTLKTIDEPDSAGLEPIITSICLVFGECLERANQQLELQSESKLKSLMSKIEQYIAKTNAK